MAKNDIDVRVRLKDGKRFKRDLTQAEKGIQRFGKRAQSIGKKMRRATVGLGAAALPILYATKRAVEGTKQLVANTNRLANLTGLTVQNASALNSVFGAFKIDAKAATMGMSKMASSAVDASRGGKGSRQAFRDLGISLKDIGKLKSDELLFRIADAMKNSEGSSKKLAAAKKLLGRGMQSLNPLLRQGSEGIKEEIRLANKYHAFIGDKQIKTMGDLRRAEREQFYAMQGLNIMLATKVAPALTKVVDKIRGLIEWYQELSPEVQTAIKYFGIFALVAGPLASVISVVTSAVAGLSTALLFLWANPIGLAILGVVALGAAFFVAYKKIKWFRDAVDSVWKFLGTKGAAIGTVLLAPFLPFALVLVQIVRNIQRIKDAFNWFKDKAGSVGGFLGGLAKKADPRGWFRAAGGPVSANRSYIVGERGPELLNMGNRGGHVVPFGGQVRAAMGGGGGYVPIVLQLDGRTVAESTARLVRNQKARS